MAKDQLIPMNGQVIDVLAGGFFRVRLERGDEVVVKLAGKMRQTKIRIVMNDKVEVGFSPYDAKNGLITRRL